MTLRLDYRYGYADVRFGQMHYAIRRNPAAGDQVLVLLNPRARCSLPMLTRFPDIGTVIGVDLPAFGRSSALPDGPAMRDIAGGFIECLDTLGFGRVDLFGLHTGHKIATAMALHWPDRIDRLIVAGRSHSLIPDHTARNAAMKAVVDENQVDMAIIRMEGRYADEPGATRAFADMFAANFAFDFAAAMRAIARPTLVLEITSEREDGLYGRQAAALIAGMPNAIARALPMTDPTGLSMYVGVDTMVDAITKFRNGAA